MYVRLAWSVLALTAMALSAPADDSKLHKQATDLVKQASDIFKNAKTLQVETKRTFTLDDGQGKRTITTEGTCVYEQPNHFALRVRRVGEEGGINCICDGKNIYTSTNVLKEYTLTPAPADLFKINASLMVVGFANGGLLFQDAFGEDPYEGLMAGVSSAVYAGKEKVGDAEAHHLKFTQDAFNWEMWVAAQGKPFILKEHASGDAGNGAKFELTETFHNWKLDEAPAKDVFAIEPAKDAKQVQNLGGGMDKK